MSNTKKISKKTARKQIEKKLKITLSALEPVLGDKKFKRRIKKAGKALTEGLPVRTSRQAIASLRKTELMKIQEKNHKNGLKNNVPKQVIVPLQKRKTLQQQDQSILQD